MSTCRLSAIVNNKDPVRFRVRVSLWLRFRAGLGLGLGLTVDTQIGTIMTINEDPSPNLTGRQVDRSTSLQVDRSTSRQFSFGSTDK